MCQGTNCLIKNLYEIVSLPHAKIYIKKLNGGDKMKLKEILEKYERGDFMSLSLRERRADMRSLSVRTNFDRTIAELHICLLCDVACKILSICSMHSILCPYLSIPLFVKVQTEIVYV